MSIPDLNDTIQPLACHVCKSPLSGRKRKYCSVRCKNSDTYHRAGSYTSQRERAQTRKAELVRLKGSKCEICGYGKNLAALCFHHPDPSAKEFPVDARSLSNRSWEVVYREFMKCQLLCHNCHMEVHYPHFEAGKI